MLVCDVNKPTTHIFDIESNLRTNVHLFLNGHLSPRAIFFFFWADGPYMTYIYSSFNLSTMATFFDTVIVKLK